MGSRITDPPPPDNVDSDEHDCQPTRRARQLAAIVRAASARPTGTARGQRSVARVARAVASCEGFITVFRRTNGEIAWNCEACGDEGVISGWEGSPADVSELDDNYAEGDEVTLPIARELFDAICGVLLLDEAGELLVARAEGSAVGVVLTGRTGAYEDLVDHAASEANAETDRRRTRLLDEACTSLATGGRKSPCSSTPVRRLPTT